MKLPVIFAALAAALIGVGPVKAQPMAADLLPPYEVATIVASMGMRPLDRPIWRHGRYSVSAIDRYGREVRVVLDARDGRVLAVRPLARDYVDEPRYAPPPPSAYPRSGPYEPRYDQPYGTPPSPPAMIPGRPPIDDDDEFFDDDRQEGSVMPSSAPRTTAIAPSKSRSSVNRREGSIKDASPLPRPRPSLAIDAADAKPAESEGKKAEAPKPDVRVIDMSKPKSVEKQQDKPGEAIRF